MILLLILVGMFSISTQAPAKLITVSGNKASTHSLSTYENVTAHKGDLIVDGTQVVVIENCTYIQTGSVYVGANAKLLFRNAELQVNQSYLDQYQMNIAEYSEVEFHGTVLDSQFETWLSIQQ